MTTRSITMVALLALSGAASAGASQLDVETLAAQSGLSERQVRMVLGARSGFAESKTSYVTSETRLKKLLGTRQFNELVAAHADKYGASSAKHARSSTSP